MSSSLRSCIFSFRAEWPPERVNRSKNTPIWESYFPGYLFNLGPCNREKDRDLLHSPRCNYVIQGMRVCDTLRNSTPSKIIATEPPETLRIAIMCGAICLINDCIFFCLIMFYSECFLLFFRRFSVPGMARHNLRRESQKSGHNEKQRSWQAIVSLPDSL